MFVGVRHNHVHGPSPLRGHDKEMLGGPEADVLCGISCAELDGWRVDEVLAVDIDTQDRGTGVRTYAGDRWRRGRRRIRRGNCPERERILQDSFLGIRVCDDYVYDAKAARDFVEVFAASRGADVSGDVTLPELDNERRYEVDARYRHRVTGLSGIGRYACHYRRRLRQERETILKNKALPVGVVDLHVDGAGAAGSQAPLLAGAAEEFGNHVAFAELHGERPDQVPAEDRYIFAR